jgi:beta-lactam-binding protein with PASTA domain
LTWTLVNRVNAEFGTAEIWKAYASAPLANVTVTSVQTLASAYHQSLTVVAFQGAGGPGAIGGASAMFGPTSASLTTTRAGSLVYGVADDSARAVAHTLGANQVLVHQWIDTAAAYTFWVQSLNSPVATAGSVVTIDNPSPTSDRWNLAIVEIVPATGASTSTVPDIVGMTQAAATAAITNAGLVVGTVTTQSSTTVPSGSVISQSPAAATEVVSGSSVSLVVSSGPPQVAVPNVVGLTQSAATTAITSAGLVVGTVTTQSSTTVPSGSVISQSPLAATLVASGSAVSLVVSSGTSQVAVPNVVGLTQAAATTAIANAGLTLGAVTTEVSTVVPAGSVISQNPAGGTQVVSSSAVALVIAAAPPAVLVVVPNVVGVTQSTATSLLTSAGLIVGTVTSTPSTTVPAGTVVSQTPIAGTTLSSGKAVDLVVSAGEPSGTPQVDVSVSADGNGTIATPPFSTTEAGELLIAFVASDGSTGLPRQSATVSGAGLVWTLVRRANAQQGTAEVWTATAPGLLVNAVVTVAQTVQTFHQSLTVVAFKGASGIGDAVPGSGRRSLPSVSLITTAPGSLIYGVGIDPERPTARTLAADETIVHQWVDKGANRTFWVQAFVAPVADGGSVATVNCVAPSSDNWNMVAVEIMPR